MLESYWTEHEGRRRKYYRLTAAGRKSLTAKRKDWQTFAEGVRGVLGLKPGQANPMGAM
jgi:DNA-binding PadR family transcriptional regulator